MTTANGTKYIAAAHGSVSEVSFKVLNSRRVMLRIKQADGKPLTKGLSVVDDKNNYVVTVVDDGHVFLNDADQISALYAVDDDNNRLCKLLILRFLKSTTKTRFTKKLTEYVDEHSTSGCAIAACFTVPFLC